MPEMRTAPDTDIIQGFNPELSEAFGGFVGLLLSGDLDTTVLGDQFAKGKALATDGYISPVRLANFAEGSLADDSHDLNLHGAAAARILGYMYQKAKDTRDKRGAKA